MSPLLRLSTADKDLASNLIARALYDYPLFRYLIPDDRQRTKRLPILTGYLVRVGLLYGEVYITSPNLEGVAVWLPPKLNLNLVDLLFRIGIVTCPFKLGFKAFNNILSYISHVETVCQTQLSTDYWYLQVISVDLAYQKQCYGKRLIEPMLAKFKAQNLPCCLDTEEESSVAYYERYGFEVIDESPIAGTNSNCWIMVKYP